MAYNPLDMTDEHLANSKALCEREIALRDRTIDSATRHQEDLRARLADVECEINRRAEQRAVCDPAMLARRIHLLELSNTALAAKVAQLGKRKGKR